MKPLPFACERSTEAADAVALLAAHGCDERPLAVRKSLAPLLNVRLARPALPSARIAPPLLVVAAMLSLVACQGSRALQFADGRERPDLPRTEDVAGEHGGGGELNPTSVTGGGAATPGELTVPAHDESSGAPTTAETSKTGEGESNAAGQDGGELQDDRSSSESSVALGTEAGGVRLAERPRNNSTAADLLDHWGHRQSHGITKGLSLTEPAGEGDAANLRRLRTATRTDDEALVAPDLQDGDEVRVLGARRGVTYGRWTGGPADTLSIEFDLSGAGWLMRGDPAFRAMLERVGKAWSHRIADTWSTWERRADTHKGQLINGKNFIEVRVEAGGEISTGLEIDVRDQDIPGVAGWASEGTRPAGESWEPRFGSIEIDRDHLRDAGEAAVFSTLAHEIGHLLGAWKGGAVTEEHAPYTDTEAGTWTGPNVVALHGGPAPFQDASDPREWFEGERDPLASEYDLAHSGVCASLMAYCNDEGALSAFLPQAIDFAFLKDLGMTVTEETERPETYGLAGWTDYAGFTLAMSRDLRMTLADPQPHYDGAANRWWTLETTDLLRVGVDAFGYRSTGVLGMSYPLEGSMGRVCYAGGLIGAAIDYDGMPPVTGDANLAVDLDTLDGTASFTSLEVSSNGIPESFGGGALHYPFALSDNAIRGTEADSTLSADFYGPEHEEIAGTLHDPRAGLLASFGATHDDRPDREDVIGAATYLVGRSYRRGASDPADDGWSNYRCGSGSSCELSEYRSGSWSAWTSTTRESVLAATAGWDWRDTAMLDADHEFVRIERQSTASTDGRQGRHVVDSYTGTLEHGAFGVGFETYSDGWTDSIGTPGGLYGLWMGAQGAVSGGLPEVRAQWSGLMLGYQSGLNAYDDPFVEGVATVDFHLSQSLVDVTLSEVASRDGQRALPDISYRGLQPQADGTFSDWDETGYLKGAFLGPGNEETVGMFRHYSTSVLGGFGARAVPDTVTLEETGTASLVGDFETSSLYAYDDWGFWGRQFGENLFAAVVEQRITREGDTTSYWTPTARISGTRSGQNPVSGEAVWLGGVRAFGVGTAGHLPVSGSARLEVDFADATVDVDLTDFGGGHGDLSWQGLRITAGSFRDAQSQPTIEGAFYGPNHQGAAGKFDRDNLRGVFGAIRN